MSEYRFKAFAAPGVLVIGLQTASSRHDALAALQRRGLDPVELEPAGESTPWYQRLLGPRTLRSRDRALVARQVSDLLAAGMPVSQALEVVRGQADSPRVRTVVRQLHQHVGEGHALSEAMAALSDHFPQVQISLARAGESGGFLAVALGEIADLEEKDQELRGRVQSALVYPTITAMAGLVTIFVILNFVVPRLSAIFDEMAQGLPWMTRALLDLSEIARWAWDHPIVVTLATLVFVYVIRRAHAWRDARDRWFLEAPRLRRLTNAVAVARFAGTLGSLLRNGVPVLPALRVTVDTMDNREVRRRLRMVCDRVSEGEALGGALDAERTLPKVVCGMITVGEATGNLEGSLARIRDSYAREVDRLVRIAVSLVEPGLIVLLGLFVAFLVAAIVIPILQVNLSIQ